MNDDKVNEIFAAITADVELEGAELEDCPRDTCSIHHRVSEVVTSPIGETLTSYQGDYFVITSTRPDRSAIKTDQDLVDELELMLLLSMAGIAPESEVKELVDRLPLEVVTEIYLVRDEPIGDREIYPVHHSVSVVNTAREEHSFYLTAIKGGMKY